MREIQDDKSDYPTNFCNLMARKARKYKSAIYAEKAARVR